MDTGSWWLGMILGGALLAGIPSPPAGDLYEVDVYRLADWWSSGRVSPDDPYTLRHAELKRRLLAFGASFPDLARVEEVGRSVENREIYLVTLGTGSEKVMLWSQMHGDEPTATSALLDLFHFFASSRDEAWVRRILDRYTLLCVPMLNPDGAERLQRRNAQGIDINRDARVLQTPEGRLLKQMRDRHRPILGFNLHNQNPTQTVGDTGRVAIIALLAVAADIAPAGRAEPGTPPARNLLAKQVSAVLYEALSPFIYGHISRYDETFNPRAFGDNLTLWGTPVVLIETGGNLPGKPSNFTVQLNFIGLLAALDSLATGKIRNANAAVFDALRMNSDSPIHDLMLRNAWIFTGTGIPLFRGDIAIRKDARAGAGGQAIIAEIGDLGVFSAHQTIDCTNMMLTPGLIAWASESAPNSSGPSDGEMLKRGVLTLIETARWDAIAGSAPPSAQWEKETRLLNWGFLLAGDLPDDKPETRLHLASWLAAGARAWLYNSPGSRERGGTVPGWFGARMMTTEEGSKFRLPVDWQGNPAAILPVWTSLAAERFRVPRRGIISQGSAADLVIWSTGSEQPPSDLADCRPAQVILNGQVIDPAQPGDARPGRFLGRN